MGSPPQAGEPHITTPLRENAVVHDSKIVVEWQSWVITRMPPERSHVSFRQLLRTYQRTRVQQLCATSGLMHRSERKDYSITSSAVASSRRRHSQAKHPGGLAVDDEFELRCLHDRQVRGFCTLEDTASIDSDLAVGVPQACSVAHQSAGFGKFAQREYRGDAVERRQEAELNAPAQKKGAAGKKKRVRPLVDETCEGCVDLATGAGPQNASLQPDGDAGRLSSRKVQSLQRHIGFECTEVVPNSPSDRAVVHPVSCPIGCVMIRSLPARAGLLPSPSGVAQNSPR